MARQDVIGTHKTTVKKDGNKLRVTYHWTDVVTVWDDGGGHCVKLDANGWQTATTKTRMNQASKQFDLKYYVFQKNFEWFVKVGDKVLDFFDGIIFRIPV